MGLRKGQKELVENYNGGLCAVPAIPGGGKTYALSVWASRAIFHNRHLGGKILIVTFMNSAAGTFKHRITRMLKNLGYSGPANFETSTIHALCLQIMKEGATGNLLDQEFFVADEFETNEVIREAVEKIFDENDAQLVQILANHRKFKDEFEKKKYVLDSLYRSAFSVINLIRTKKLRYLNDDLLTTFYNDVYEEYRNILNQKGIIDFNDMLEMAYDLLVNDQELLNTYQRRYSVVCEDEAQDSNGIQGKILELISNGNFIRVGDGNQSICGTFTSSSPEFFKEFCSRDITTTYTITESSRNTVQIIDLANEFVKLVRESHPQRECRESLLPQYIEPVSPLDFPTNPVFKGLGIDLKLYEDIEKERLRTALRVRDARQVRPNSTIAVLLSSNKAVEDIIQELEKLGVPYEQLGSASQLSLKAIELLSGCLGILLKEKKKYDAFDKLLAEKGIKKKELLGFLNSVSLFPYASFFAKLANFLQFEKEQGAIAEFMSHRAGVLVNMGEVEVLKRLYEELNYKNGPVGRFSSNLRDLDGFQPEPGIVTVSTYHKAKGLEWDLVFMCNLCGYEFPSKLNEATKGEAWKLSWNHKHLTAAFLAQAQGQAYDLVSRSLKLQTMDERARLLYVGITRAKECLMISGYKSKGYNIDTISWYLVCLNSIIEKLKGKYLND